MTDLLPCPFCGSTNLGSGGDDKVVWVWCLKCKADGPNHYGSHEWNDRTITPAQAAKVLLDGLEKLWSAEHSTETNNARIKTERDGHKYRVIDREGFRAALRAIANGGQHD